MLPYDAIAPSGAGAPVQRSMLRMRAVAAVVAIAMVACVALLGAGSLPVGRSELVILGDKHVGLNRLVFKVLSKGDKMSISQLAEMVQSWVPSGPPRFSSYLQCAHGASLAATSHAAFSTSVTALISSCWTPVFATATL